MAVVSSRLVFQLSAICILIAPAIVRPQQYLNYLNSSCSDKQGNYTSGSTYKANLNLVLSPLSSNSTDFDYGFYNSSCGRNPDKVHAIGLCRGDFKSDVCRNCFVISKAFLTQSCPNQKEAIVWFEECMLRYSSRNILSSMEDSTPAFPWKNYHNVSDYKKVEFNITDLWDLLQNLSGQAAAALGSLSRKFDSTARRKGSNKSQTAIILAVAAAVAIVVQVIIAIYIYLRVRKPRERPGIQSTSTRRTSSSMVAPTLPLSSKFRWDVFLSFRGADTRKNFISHLYSSLGRVGIRIFRDDEELLRGETISAGLLNAIQESKIFIVVFSKDFASSRWCLDELVEIVDRRKTIGHTFLPIFYHINPSDVRRQTGTFAEAFARHEEQFHNNIFRVHRWKKALTEAANCSGLDLESIANGHEARFIEEIVEHVLRILKVSDGLNVAHIQQEQTLMLTRRP